MADRAKWTWARSAALLAAAAGLGVAAALLACSESPTEEMDRGVAVDDESSTPESAGEMALTEEERRQKAMMEEQALERREFNESGQGDDSGQGAPEGAPE
jgi:hypothetical protein